MADSTRSILIAEDEPINFMLLQKMLEKYPARIIWAQNGQEAVETVEKDHSIAIILMDIRMPKLNGIEATKAIHAKHPNLPIVAVTAFNLSNEREQCLNAGAVQFLSKPIIPANLTRVIEEYCNF